MVPAVVARDAWRYEEVKDDWDKLVMKSYVTVRDSRILYQEFSLSRLLNPDYHFGSHPELREDGNVLFGGSSGASPGVPSDIYQFQSSLKDLKFPNDFGIEIHDPVANRKITHRYDVLSLEGAGSISL